MAGSCGIGGVAGSAGTGAGGRAGSLAGRGARTAGGVPSDPAVAPSRCLRGRSAGERRPGDYAARGVAVRGFVGGGKPAVTLRTRLLLIFTVVVVATVALVEILVSRTTRNAFERMENQRVEALVTQFRREFARRGDEIVRAVNSIAASDAATSIALSPDPAAHYNEAPAL